MSKNSFEFLKEDFALWCQNHNGWVRLPLIFLLGYLFYQYQIDTHYYGIFGAINLGIHEVGHLLFSPFGLFVNALGGTLFQIIVPIYGFFNFLFIRDYFAAPLCFGWLAANLYGISAYIADARSQSLPLLTPFGGHPQHDWHYLLGQLGWLEYDVFLAGIVKVMANVSMSLALALCFYIFLRMVGLAERKKAGLNPAFRKK